MGSPERPCPGGQYTANPLPVSSSPHSAPLFLCLFYFAATKKVPFLFLLAAQPCAARGEPLARILNSLAKCSRVVLTAQCTLQSCIGDRPLTYVHRRTRLGNCQSAGRSPARVAGTHLPTNYRHRLINLPCNGRAGGRSRGNSNNTLFVTFGSYTQPQQ